MKKEQLFEAIGHADEKLLLESGGESRKKITWMKYAAVAACLVLVLAVALPLGLKELKYQKNAIALSDASRDVRAAYTKKVPDIQMETDLIGLTEEELFTHFDTAIFSGTVTDIQNIVIDFNGDKSYRAIANIQAEKVYRGPVKSGEIVSVLLPCPVGEEIQVTDTEVVSAMREGMHGIFMPVIYDEASYWEQNGAALLLKDLADYGFADGVRYAFLETERGLVFDRDSYESIAGAKSLEEIEAYIFKMIAK